MQEIAEQFHDKGRYQKAAAEFRLPYWDCFRPRGFETHFPGVPDRRSDFTSFGYDFSLPKVLTEQNLMVYRPGAEDRLQAIKNPLYSFNFPRSGSLTPQEWRLSGARVRFNGLRGK